MTKSLIAAALTALSATLDSPARYKALPSWQRGQHPEGKPRSKQLLRAMVLGDARAFMQSESKRRRGLPQGYAGAKMARKAAQRALTVRH